MKVNLFHTAFLTKPTPIPKIIFVGSRHMQSFQVSRSSGSIRTFISVFRSVISLAFDLETPYRAFDESIKYARWFMFTEYNKGDTFFGDNVGCISVRQPENQVACPEDTKRTVNEALCMFRELGFNMKERYICPSHSEEGCPPSNEVWFPEQEFPRGNLINSTM